MEVGLCEIEREMTRTKSGAGAKFELKLGMRCLSQIPFGSFA